MALTYKQHLFVAYYLGESGGNATDAARRAGYAWPEKVAERLVGKSGIKAAIEAKLGDAALSAREVLARISEIATGDIGELIEIRPDNTWGFDIRKARRRRKTGLIKKLKVNKDGATELELHDPQAALDKLAKFHGLYKDRPEEGGKGATDGAPDDPELEEILRSYGYVRSDQRGPQGKDRP